jgi:hypothetical protein
MKKVLSLSVLAFGMLLGAGVNAATTSGTLTADGVVSNASGSCDVLGQQINVKVSKNVQMAWQCNNTSSVMVAGACSTAGSTKPGTGTCSYSTSVDATSGETVFTANYPTCPGVANNGTPPDPAATVPTVGRNAYVGTSSGGAVTPTSLIATSTCTGADILGTPTFVANQ